MTDYSELKRLAEAATPGPYRQCGADSESKSCTCGQIWSTATDELVAFVHNGDEMIGAPAAGQPANAQFFAAASPTAVLALIAENELLRTTKSALVSERQAHIRQRDQLKAENEALRKAANDLRRFLTCEDVHHDKPDQHEYGEPCKVLSRIDAVLGWGEKSGG